jgi:hypothetical protein
MRSSVSVLSAAVLLCAAGWSQTPKPVDDAETAQTGFKPASSPKADRRSNVAVSRSLGSSYASSLWEYWVNQVIPAGGSLDLDSEIDFSSSETARVTVRSDSANLGDIALAAYWTVPTAPYFNIADVVKGSGSYYRNAFGATFNTYGSRFRLRILNNGSSAVTLRQVLISTLSL